MSLPSELNHPNVHKLLQLSLTEDLTAGTRRPRPAIKGDVTAYSTIPAAKILNGRIIAKATGVVAGLPVTKQIMKMVDDRIQMDIHIPDGSRVKPRDVLATISGPGRAVLVAERPGLNFLGRLSGIASLTRQFVDAVEGTGAIILDTRKTAPGFRLLDKYAVKMGGGTNHRMGLYHQAMVKDNHVVGAGGLTQAVASIRDYAGSDFPIIVEVETLEQLREVLPLKVHRILLDNMDNDTMREAVQITNKQTPLEASGNVNLSTVRGIAETGVDYISSGALTHSAKTFDISLEIA